MAEVSSDNIQAIINNDLYNLVKETALVVRYTDLVLAHNSVANDLREKYVPYGGMMVSLRSASVSAVLESTQL